MQRRDPIVSFADALIRSGSLTDNDLATLKKDSEKTVDTAYSEALLEAAPDPISPFMRLFSSTPTKRSRPHLGRVPETTMVAEVTRVLAARMAVDPRVILFGQDIEDPKGGVFGFTKGLSTQFPDRVFNAPLAEATIIGAGIGLAATGYRPVFELQFVDFITPGFMQLSSQAATLSWRSKADCRSPPALYAP